jgi:phosphate transport system protein
LLSKIGGRVVEEMRRTFHDRLAAVHDEVAELGGGAVTALRSATAALLAGDASIEAVVVARADEYLERTRAVEREVFDLIAMQAPVARDLRLLLASMRVGEEFQLCHGLAASIARRVASASAGAIFVAEPSVTTILAEMGDSACCWLERARGSYVVLDRSSADKVATGALEVHDMQGRFVTALFGLRDAAVEPVVELGLIARFFERVSDHAVEIARRVAFVADGEWVP